jgi:hypothetical protein
MMQKIRQIGFAIVAALAVAGTAPLTRIRSNIISRKI